MDIQSFRTGSASRLVLDNAVPQQATGTVKANIGLKERFAQLGTPGGSFFRGSATQQTENTQFRTAFKAALEKAEGPGIADKAARKCGLKAGWEQSTKPLSSRQVKQLLDKAQELRMDAIKTNNKAAKAFLKGGPTSGFGQVFTNLAAHHGAKAEDLGNRDLHARFLREVRRDAAFGQGSLSQNDLTRIATKTINDFYGERVSRFNEQHSGLAQFVQAGHVGTPRPDSRSFFAELTTKLVPTMAQGHALAGEPQAFRHLAQGALNEVQSNYGLLNKMSYEADGLRALRNELNDKHARLDQIEQSLRNLAQNDHPQSQVGQDLEQGLIAELQQQKDLLTAKLGMLDDMRAMNPFSQKTVAYSNLLWANAAGHVIDQAKQWLQNNPPQGGPGAIQNQLDQATTQFVNQYTNAYTYASLDVNTIEPSKVTDKAQKKALKHTHPIAQGREQSVDFLKRELARAGLPQDQIDRLVGKENMGEARRKALDTNQTWAPVVRDMVVNKDGLTRTYRSKITPGSQINARLGRLYTAPQQGQNMPGVDARPGVSSGNKADHYHARNLKLSELERVLPNGQTQTMAKVVGHGVLDMWDIADPVERQAANRRGAKEVLETAVSTNDRVTRTALNRIAAGDNTPVKVTHVSVNLITPSTPRDWVIEKTNRGVMPHHMEGRYTDNQFEAFRANTTAGNNNQPVTLTVDDTRPGGQLGQDVDINVDIDVISFSFAINPLATGFHLPDSIAGWSRVYEHNQGMMQKFVGNLGSGREGSVGSRPGGFIGQVYDRLDLNNPAQATLAAQIREQTDIVREMFTSESFKRGDGDPAKMSRHILMLQGLADQALELTNATDMAATSSKGCKSDKDRGGVTDVELKHMMVSEDMGGQIRPNELLGDEDQENYYVVASNSGQFENQQLNTGIAGSKEAGKLDLRIPSKTVRNFLAGLGKFASE
jgi:phosphatidylinositol-4,5-bisphosphate 4-phosphatase